jgi:ABC-type transport system involved in multi-copper enzyme maturation permease subunit
MNSHVARALLDDAFYQVLDNKVFRLLALLALVFIAPTFLIGFHPHDISILFGWQHLDYADLFKLVGNSVPEVKDVHVQVISTVQSVFVDKLAGNFGTLFCIAATAFFVPRMLEKGAADIVFSKPVSRLALILARYLSGLLFVAILAVLLVVGMHIGFLVTSGYSDPGFLWSALTLVYVFALIHAFSTCVAAFTRSSVATILITSVMFVFNGCVQSLWVANEHHSERERVSRETRVQDPERAAAIETKSDDTVIALLRLSIQTMHYALPKTNDAEILTRKLRSAVSPRNARVTDREGNLCVEENPDDFTLEHGGELDLSKEPARWIARDAHGVEEGRIELSRRSRVIEKTPGDARGSKPGAEPKVRRQFASDAATELARSLLIRPEVKVKPTRGRDRVGALGAETVTWTERGDAHDVARQHTFFTSGDWMFELDISLRAGWLTEDQRDERIGMFLARFTPAEPNAISLNQADWYARQLTWSAPLRYNVLFSIGSSFAFCLAMLALAWWKIARIDF